MNKLKILLVEDLLGERLKVMNILREFNVEIESAVTFERARDLVSKRKYDLIISEMLLSHCPEFQGDGIQFWNYIQNMHPQHELLLLTDDAMQHHTRMLLDGEAIPNMISKPVCRNALTFILHDRLQWVKKVAA